VLSWGRASFVFLALAARPLVAFIYRPHPSTGAAAELCGSRVGSKNVAASELLADAALNRDGDALGVLLRASKFHVGD
ncbi:MAG: hypothetical protein ACRETD_10900, partial [Steroidobacteraceae bacterium]